MSRVAPAAAARLKRETKIRISLLGKIEKLQQELVAAGINDQWKRAEGTADIDETFGQLLALVEDAPFRTEPLA